MANYPQSLKRFTTHRNLIDDVDAGDINAIQDELEAVQTTIGVDPLTWVDAQAQTTDFYAQLVLPPTDDGGLESAVVGSLTGYGVADRGVRSEKKTYNNLSHRLDVIQKRQEDHCFELRANGIDIPASGGSVIENRPNGIRFPRPSNAKDPFSLHNGIGVTLKRSGFYTFSGTIIYNLTGNAANNEGLYQGAIDRDGDWLVGMNRVEVKSRQGVVLFNVLRQGFMERGTRMSLRTSHNSGATQRLRTAVFAGHMTREDV